MTEEIQIPIESELRNRIDSLGELNPDGSLNEAGTNRVKHQINKATLNEDDKLYPTAYKRPFEKLQYALLNLENKEKDDLLKLYLSEYNGLVSFNHTLHLFHINNTLSEVFKNTNNEIRFRKLPFKDIILDCDIKYKKRRVQGIIISEFNFDDEGFTEKINEKEIKTHNPDWHVTLLEYPFDVLGGITKEENKTEAKVISFMLIQDLETKKEYNKIREYICNFVDFLDEPDVETVIIETSEERVKKRLKRGKQPNPAQCHIRISGKLYEYINSIEKGLQTHLSHRFWVRGHWRHFKSDKYKQKKGKKEWIKPFIKGKGILIQKQYNVQKMGNRRE